ncbi:MAG: lipopolysaccharide kinase InaA family protein [Lachnoclostridium sp.]|nr:lipopolysaccharide kinase InaA family protein [Lachnoclostridium sp.]
MASTKIEINPAYGHIEAQVRDIVTNGIPDDAQLIYNGRNRIWRVMIDGMPVIVKAFRRPRLLNALIYKTFRKSKAYRSYHNSLRLMQLGFSVPAPIAYAEVSVGPLLADSYYFSAEVKGDDLRYWERRTDCRELEAALAGEVNRIINAGVCHLDLSPGNVIFTRDATGNYTFSYIDLNRMKFDVSDYDRLLTAAFQRLNELEPTLSVARQYALQSGQDVDETVAKVRKIRLDFEHQMAMKKKLKSLWKLR